MTVDCKRNPRIKLGVCENAVIAREMQVKRREFGTIVHGQYIVDDLSRLVIANIVDDTGRMRVDTKRIRT